MLEKFLKTWGERGLTRAQYSIEATHPPPYGKDPADATLALSRRLITVVKAKNILSIEAGMEMIALAMAISSEVCDDSIVFTTELISLWKNNGVFPEQATDVKSVLRRFEQNPHASWRIIKCDKEFGQIEWTHSSLRRSPMRYKVCIDRLKM